MKRVTKMVISGVLVITLSVAAISLVFYQPSRPVSIILVEGGHFIEETSSSIVVRALGSEMNVSLIWHNTVGPGLFEITVTNMNPERMVIESDAQIRTLEEGNASRTIEVRTLSAAFTVHFSTEIPNNTLNFYVLGDSQGYQDGIGQVVESANNNLPDFIFHCGDITPFGQENQYADVLNTLRPLNVPLFTTAGNHDIRQGGDELYKKHFGPLNYSFDFGLAHFVVLDTSSGDIPEEALKWLESDLFATDLEWKFIFTHIPPLDPRSGMNHTLTNPDTINHLIDILETTDTDAIFSGHIHMFNHSIINDVNYIITGGAGATLYASPEEGGFHHYAEVVIEDSTLSFNTIPLEEPSFTRDMVVIRGYSEDVTLYLDDLTGLPATEGYTSVQNQFDNWRAQGIYRGITISGLLQLVGGLNSGDIIRVTAADGYQQDFAYSNVYPNSTIQTIQGDLLLAYSFNGTLIPSWSDGLRLVMVPEDGAFSNEDCLLTSEPGMGYHLYPSAGARWVSNVVLIEVIQVGY
ncbi:MAG: metallophosphoesterase [Candidatus Thorarchaeota archaeon]